MPEGPELHLTSLFINKTCKDLVFSGKILRNPIHKCPEIEWDEPLYTISAESKGKELMVHLNAVLDKNGGKKKSQKLHLEPIPSVKNNLSIRFTFGMSGKFDFTPEDKCPKHSHLRFLTKNEPKMSLSFVDYRRFGKWFVGGLWSTDRGPCVINEYDAFVENIVNNLDNPAFNKPICEVLLNQKFFNGIGNYLRAEILYRCKIPPFEKASNVLRLNECKEENSHIKEEIKSESETEGSKGQNQKSTGKKSRKRQPKVTKNEEDHSAGAILNDVKELSENNSEKQDFKNKSPIEKLTPQAQELLKLCHTVPIEVVNLGSTKYTLSDMYEDQEDGSLSFNTWLQCYYKPGMKNLVDHNKRTIWFTGPAGQMVPSSQKSRGLCKAMIPSTPSVKKEEDEEKPELPKQKLKTKRKVVQENEILPTENQNKRQVRNNTKKRKASGGKTKKLDERSNGNEGDECCNEKSRTTVKVEGETLAQTKSRTTVKVEGETLAQTKSRTTVKVEGETLAQTKSRTTVKVEGETLAQTKRKRRAQENIVGKQSEELPKIRSSKRLKSQCKVL